MFAYDRPRTMKAPPDSFFIIGTLQLVSGRSVYDQREGGSLFGFALFCAGYSVLCMGRKSVLKIEKSAEGKK